MDSFITIYVSLWELQKYFLLSQNIQIIWYYYSFIWFLFNDTSRVFPCIKPIVIKSWAKDREKALTFCKQNLAISHMSGVWIQHTWNQLFFKHWAIEVFVNLKKSCVGKLFDLLNLDYLLQNWCFLWVYISLSDTKYNPVVFMWNFKLSLSSQTYWIECFLNGPFDIYAESCSNLSIKHGLMVSFLFKNSSSL